MPLLEVIQSRQISASVRFDETTATLVDQYAAFIHATADDVVNKALNYVFAKDRDFQDTSRAPMRGTSCPRFACAEALFLPTRSQAHTQGHCRGGVDRVSPGRKAMIIPQKPWREENRASHGLYLDTPPLKGWRSLPIGSDCYLERNQQIEELAIANGISWYRDPQTMREHAR